MNEKNKDLQISSSQQDQGNQPKNVHRVSALLTLIRALCGFVTPKLRSVKIELDENIIRLFFYFDGELSKSEREAAERIGEEVSWVFPENKLETNVSRLDFPERIPERGETVYKRKE